MYNCLLINMYYYIYYYNFFFLFIISVQPLYSIRIVWIINKQLQQQQQQQQHRNTIPLSMTLPRFHVYSIGTTNTRSLARACVYHTMTHA